MKVWRVEHPSDGLGAFRSEHGPSPEYWTEREYNQFVRSFEHNGHKNPAPQEDAADGGRLGDWDAWVEAHKHDDVMFGVQEEPTLKIWFTPLMVLMLKKHGFVVRCYDADDFFTLPTQVAFCKQHARLVETKPLEAEHHARSKN